MPKVRTKPLEKKAPSTALDYIDHINDELGQIDRVLGFLAAGSRALAIGEEVGIGRNENDDAWTGLGQILEDITDRLNRVQNAANEMHAIARDGGVR